jgi:hypothetical protein
MRGALRRFARAMKRKAASLAGKAEPEAIEQLQSTARSSIHATQEVLRRFRTTTAVLGERYGLSDKTLAALKLVDEYLSLQVEQYFRRVVVHMEGLPKVGALIELRRDLMDVVLTDESYRKVHGLPSVLAPGTDNEAYSHRISFLKKFCQNILFLKVQRSSPRKAWEEVLFSVAAGGAMAFALGVGLFAQSRYPQASFNFFVIAVLGYMLKDRIKEGLRRLFSAYAGRYLYERTTRIFDPVTRDEVGVCHEKVEYGGAAHVPPDVARLRHQDDLITAAQGELGETVIRYRKKIVLDSDQLPKIADGIVTGITDIIRINVDTLLHDMDDPEFELEYVDLDDFSVEKVRLAKSYRVDVAFRCSVDDGAHQRTTVRVVRLVLDRNGIKRMTDLVPETVVAEKAPAPAPTPVAA